MSIKLSIILILVSFSSCAIKNPARRGFEPGYVVTWQNDTIAGYVRDRSDSNFPDLYRKIRFRSSDGKGHKYGPKQIKAYQKGFESFETLWIHTFREFLVTRYISQPGVGKPHFMKIVRKGYLSYYHWEYVDGEFQDIEHIPLFKREDGYSMVRVTQGILGLKKKRLSEFFQDCPDLVNKINAGEIRNPFEIHDFYNQWVEAGRYR